MTAQFVEVTDTDQGVHTINVEQIIQFIKAPDDPLGEDSSYIVFADGTKIYIDAGQPTRALDSYLRNYRS